MADRKPFLLRLDERTFVALKRWADDDLRSVNAQVEFLLRRALEHAGRTTRPAADAESNTNLTMPGSNDDEKGK